MILGISKAWDAASLRSFGENGCQVCGKESGLREIKSGISAADIRAAIPAIKRNSDEALNKREQDAREKADKELARRALVLAQKLAAQNTPAQLKAKLDDANRVMPKRNRVITLE